MFRALLEGVARRLQLTRGRCRLEANFEDGRLRDVVVQSRLTVPQLEEVAGEGKAVAGADVRGGRG